MLKNPIPKVTNQLQYRAIGIIYGKFNPQDTQQLNRGFLTDNKGEKIETVVLGKALSLLKKHIDLKKSYYWIVYPKNKSTQNLHLQVVGIWDPYQLNHFPNDSSKTNFSKLLEELELIDNYFSVRGELVFVNAQKKEFVIKIYSSSKQKIKNKNFKLVIKGELSLELLNSFISLDVIRDGNSLKLLKYEVIEKNLSKNN
ncbi:MULTISPECIES: hypothetical protein [Prochlorococcus]|uniref:Uncharacterized protein n=1 Tax=Prochlorococcus marinus str. MIT 9116 TaxID=167544 RepID=A0A0A1ZSJ1_PROMR|nr:hypothetical protein [Prochlorococcus marinus]KGF91047.1 hypothetical protein EU92_0865 [Prochlorococcus marinus str. MIT 9107]KGF91506.1 hypothetical protein EU93_1099 [Prochlorococcus marinus str. MIT 9116]KGF93256.1 hypothetical protein EU94_1409 [Prochlorococcus marinus str. MIT 9123]